MKFSTLATVLLSSAFLFLSPGCEEPDSYGEAASDPRHKQAVGFWPTCHVCPGGDHSMSCENCILDTGLKTYTCKEARDYGLNGELGDASCLIFQMYANRSSGGCGCSEPVDFPVENENPVCQICPNLPTGLPAENADIIVNTQLLGQIDCGALDLSGAGQWFPAGTCSIFQEDARACCEVSEVVECPVGYEERSGECVVVDVCAAGLHDCDDPPRAFCVNGEDGYTCECRSGFIDADPTLPGRECLEEGANRIPFAVASASRRSALAGQVVVLDGTKSYDLDGDSLTYRWSQVGGDRDVTLIEESEAVVSYRTPTSFQLVTLIFELVVNDGTDDSKPSTVYVTIRPRIENKTRIFDLAGDNPWD